MSLLGWSEPRMPHLQFGWMIIGHNPFQSILPQYRRIVVLLRYSPTRLSSSPNSARLRTESNAG